MPFRDHGVCEYIYMVCGYIIGVCEIDNNNMARVALETFNSSSFQAIVGVTARMPRFAYARLRL